MGQIGVNRDNQKRINRGLVLKLIATSQCSSRIDLSNSMGLTKTAISQITSELITKDYLVETHKQTESGVGRNPIGLGISPKGPRFVGVLISRTNCQAVLCDMQLKILKFEKADHCFEQKEDLIEAMFQVVDKVLMGEENVIAIGAASIGPVNIKEGKICSPYFFHGISNIPVRQLLEERYKMPVYFDHDNQSAVLAEQLYGNGSGYQDVLLVSVGIGVGCGILVGGRRVHSYLGYAPEIGHISIAYDGKKCICGNRGCLERYINKEEITNEFREATGLKLEYKDFCAMRNNPKVEEIMKGVADKLAIAIASTLNIMNSQIVLLCGACIDWQEKDMKRIEKLINEKHFNNKFGAVIPVRKAFFEERVHVIGAAANAVNRVFSGDLL